jgi:hypothetical protein
MPPPVYRREQQYGEALLLIGFALLATAFFGGGCLFAAYLHVFRHESTLTMLLFYLPMTFFLAHRAHKVDSQHEGAIPCRWRRRPELT